jgi:hypothetical protein
MSSSCRKCGRVLAGEDSLGPYYEKLTTSPAVPGMVFTDRKHACDDGDRHEPWVPVAEQQVRQQWLKQEHDRRVKLLGRPLAEDWATEVASHAKDGMVPVDTVLQLMEDVYRNARAGRVSGPQEAARVGAVQRPFEEGTQ